MQIAPNLQLCFNLAEEFSKSRNQDLNVVSLFCQIILSNEKYSIAVEKVGFQPEFIVAKLQAGVETNFPDLLKGERAAQELKDVQDTAIAVAEDFELEFIDCEHIMFALLQESPTINGWMELTDFPREKFRELTEEFLSYDDSEEDDTDEIAPTMGEIPATINKFLENISAKALPEGKTIFGREKEISEISNILVRERKNNVLLIGENGVGRKSICRGLAENIIMGKVSNFLAGRIVYQLDVGKIVAGSSMVGVLESRMSSLQMELEKEEDAILIIPNIISSIGAGNKEGAMDVANLLKPILASSKIPVIAICTQGEYKKGIEKDSGLSTLFEPLQVEEPSKEETRKILVNSLEKIQRYHLVNIELPAVDEIIDLCERFLPYRRFPEKAFDVLDSILAENKNKVYTHPQEILNLEDKLVEQLQKQDAQKVEKLSELYAKKLVKWQKKVTKHPPIVTVKAAIDSFARKYKITNNQIRQSQSHLLDDLADRIKTEVHGQDQAVEKVCDLLLCTKVGLRDTTKPLGKFLFAGSSSTGKTFMGKKLAKYYFGDEKAYLKIDMSEFQSHGSSSALIGTTAGYIGFESGGRLTEYIKHHPSTVVIFDEIEKAHPDVVNLLLQIMDDGYITDGQGYKVDFTNTIIIMTGNVGANQNKRSMGFLNDKTVDENYNKAIKNHFKPEILARIDEIIIFNEIDDSTAKKIIQDSVNQVINNLAAQKISLIVDDSVVESIHCETKKQEAHARNVQSIVRKILITPLSKKLLKQKPAKILAKMNEGKLEIS